MRATSSSDEQQNNPWQPQHASGRDSVDYHQYLEKIEKFRVNNPKVNALTDLSTIIASLFHSIIFLQLEPTNRCQQKDVRDQVDTLVLVSYHIICQSIKWRAMQSNPAMR